MNARIRIKMCGMTRKEDISYAISLGVDAIGLIFYPESPRYVTLKQAKLLLEGLPAFVDAVAVFVNPKPLWVHQVITELSIQYLQFHGEELPKFCEQFARPYIKAVPASSAELIQNMSQQHGQAKALLLDTPSSTQKGGSGKVFDWEVIPSQMSQPIILAGGLNALNVDMAVNHCVPYAVDVCSGVELSPGIKDSNKMSQFVRALWGHE